MSHTYRNGEDSDRRSAARFDREFRRDRKARRAISKGDGETEQDQ